MISGKQKSKNESLKQAFCELKTQALMLGHDIKWEAKICVMKKLWNYKQCIIPQGLINGILWTMCNLIGKSVLSASTFTFYSKCILWKKKKLQSMK